MEEFYAKFYAVLLHLNSQNGILKINDIYEFQSVQQRKEVIGSMYHHCESVMKSIDVAAMCQIDTFFFSCRVFLMSCYV